MADDKEIKLAKIYQKLADHFGRQNWWPTSEAFPRQEWEIMLGAILTQNTSWKNVETALDQLAEAGITTSKDFTSESESEVKNAIKPSGYYRQKYDRIMRLTKLIEREKEKRNCFSNKEALQQLEQNLTREDLLEIKGIGPETADAILLYAFNRLEFVVDAYTRRILNRLEIAQGDESYDQLKAKLDKSVETDVKVYQEFHALLDELAKNYCKKREPNCLECPIGTLCSFYSQKK